MLQHHIDKLLKIFEIQITLTVKKFTVSYLYEGIMLIRLPKIEKVSDILHQARK